ncbi:uncharacterized protein [Dermacentor albipictus]|uniref:uncharacterized protein n=1 Tax=Dermacentor albipictus TaxID=60249 RepID=UPI0038FCAB7B
MAKISRRSASLLCDHLLYADLSWADIEDLFLPLPEATSRRHGRRQYTSRKGWLDVGSIEDDVFRRMFRFEKANIDELLSALLIPNTIESIQGVQVSGKEALLIALRRLAYPNRWSDLEDVFGRHTSVMSSIVASVFGHIETTFGHLLSLTNHRWLNLANIALFSQAVHDRGAPLTNCWGFVDGTARPICRPTYNQRMYFSGHKRVHVVKYQAIMCANGIVCDLAGPYLGHRHDAGILRESGLYEKLLQLMQGNTFTIYGDPAYPLRPLLMRPYAGARLNEQQQEFNTAMSTVRQSVEWGFGKTISLFAFLDYKKNQKVFLQNVPQMYKVATILTNCHTCLHGNQVAMFFHLRPPPLKEYLVLHNS